MTNSPFKKLHSKFNTVRLEKFQPRFKPNNPGKYKGNVNNIQYRSSWEFKYMKQLDSDPTVVEWSSEEFCIPYTSPKDKKIHRYFPDFLVTKKEKGGELKTYVVEIKPEGQCKVPQKGAKKHRTFLKEAMTYGINQAKWEAAERYCKSKGYEFVVLTEKELGIK